MVKLLWFSYCRSLCFYFLITWIIFTFTFYLFIRGCTRTLLLRTGFLWLWQEGAPLQVWRAGFSLRWLLSGRHRLGSCGMWTWLPQGMWNPPGPGVEPVSPRTGRQVLNHWTTREVLSVLSLISFYFHISFWSKDTAKVIPVCSCCLQCYTCSAKM